MTNNSEISSIMVAKESRDTARHGGPGRFFKMQKSFLVIFAILAAGVIELVIILLINSD
ncbi:MAG: hypothetical protein IH840_16290 [Candidatus Heimdallarchaeota archaeon]|nr:hypothetical protein [Candidatus Heimdallarchaeota archaeon]